MGSANILAYGENEQLDHFSVEVETLITLIIGRNDSLDELT